jgi:hypothetical protein
MKNKLFSYQSIASELEEYKKLTKPKAIEGTDLDSLLTNLNAKSET